MRLQSPFTAEEEIVPPQIGMVFPTDEDAFLFYKSYAYRVGFVVVKRTSHNFYGIRQSITLCCNKERKPKTKKNVTEGFQKRKHGVQSTQCLARIRVKDFNVDGHWTVEFVELDHNHELFPDLVRYMRCHRMIPNFVRRQLEINDEAGIPINRSIHSMFTQAGGYENCNFTERDLRNLLLQRKALKLTEGDAASLMRYFKERQTACPNFFYLCDIDDTGRLRNVFWADGRSRAAYKYFGDVLTFDTTYLTNEYDMPFAPFTGVNHHGQSILMGKPPQAVITDQCAAMGAAIANVFPSARHRLCLWHIMKKLPTKVGGGDKREEIIAKASNLVYDSGSANEFEYGWLRMIGEFSPGACRSWFETMYELRNKWVPLYVKKYFWAGMSTTQRSESMNAFFKDFITKHTTLFIFVGKVDQALREKFEKELLGFGRA
ncbi:hypothetical protein LUZ60_013475 [Juncus effusus]|nr:hypothetical protein LUZ60_013475 [Juncus effusus]